MTAGEVLGRMTSLEITFWRALDQIDADDARLAELGETAVTKLEARRGRRPSRR